MAKKLNIEKTTNAQEVALAKTFGMPLLSVRIGSRGISVYNKAFLKLSIKEEVFEKLVTNYLEMTTFRRLFQMNVKLGNRTLSNFYIKNKENDMRNTCIHNKVSSEILKIIVRMEQENNLLKDNVSKLTNHLKMFINALKPQNRNSVDGLISIKELCSRLSISKPTIHNWVKGGILTKVKIGGRTYFDINEVSNLIEQKGGK